MAHTSETEARLAGFLRGDIRSRSFEGRFNVAPIHIDTRAPDAQIESAKQRTAFNIISPRAQFATLSSDDAPAIRTRASSIGRVLGGIAGLGLGAAVLISGVAMLLNKPELYLFAASIALISGFFAFFSLLASGIE